MNPIQRRAVLLTGGTLLGLILAAGCDPGPARQKLDRVWPPPPARARFRLVQIIRGSADLGRPSFADTLRALTVGAKKHALARPQSAAVSADGGLFVAEPALRGVHVFDLHSAKSSFISSAGEQPLVSPVGVAECDGQLAVSDSTRQAVFLFTPDGKLVRTLAKPGGFKRPTGLAFDAKEKLLYVVDTLANEVCVFRLSGKLVRRFGARGKKKGQFNYPTHVFVDEESRAYVTDSLNFRVQVFDRSGRYLFEIGKQGDASGHLGVPKGVAVDRFGHIYIADSYFGTVQVFDQKGRFLLALGEPGAAPGSFQLPCGLAIASQDRIFVCDSFNGRVQVIRYLGEPDAQPAPDH